jgi:polysaccharide biosynthesis protein domain protein (fragment)
VNKINNKLVAKNTLLLYVRMILMMAIQLYTVPIIMKCLGISDYGLYNVVGGITTFLAFVQGALTSGSQRFLSFSIGEDNNNALKQTFITTRSIYVILGMLMLIMLEIGGVWFLNAKMNIPENRLYAANWVLQFSIISFILNFINIPYTAVLIAHEKMNVYAYITITESILKLIGVILLQFIFLIN